ncbi:MAG: Apolipoprotein N-acyltransferase [Gemmatimonadetes bacterium]|nr:Apolipoprotein N-acyltransferase [Gemmatimonadota bacterium]
MSEGEAEVVRAGGRRLRPTRDEAVAAAASAALFALAFPPLGLLGPAFLCLVPMAVFLARQADAGASARVGVRVAFWFGILGYGANVYWIASALSIYTKLAILGYFGALVVMAVMTALWGGAYVITRRRTGWALALLLPLTWVAHEIAIDYLPDLAFPWLPLGLSTAQFPVVAQLADISGIRGVSFWIAAVAGTLADMFIARRVLKRQMLGIVVTVAAVVGYGLHRLSSIELHKLAPIAVIQPNVPQQDKWLETNQGKISGMLAAGTRQVLANSHPTLILWPEVSLPDFLFRHPEWKDTLSTLATQGHSALLAGIIDLQFRTQEDYDYWNAAILIDSTGGATQRIYHKGKLVPIVERVPFFNPRWFTFLGRYFGGYGRGGEPVLFHAGDVKFGVLICYESIFPRVSREYKREGANLLVNITNDAWFGRSLAPWQHLAHLRMRAIENRLPVARSANTGISGWIDPLGRVRAATDIFVPAAQTYDVETTDAVSPYVRFGDWVSLLSVIGTVAIVAMGFRKNRVPSIEA